MEIVGKSSAWDKIRKFRIISSKLNMSRIPTGSSNLHNLQIALTVRSVGAFLAQTEFHKVEESRSVVSTFCSV